ncbi:MAG: preprotein translocase subunit SecA [Gammaproteobacteria bacterium]|nr:preprotein translocase subunit SecA [Gammaproteobacteria bacterium]
MISKLVRKIIGSRNDRQIKQYWKVVEKINLLESDFEKLTDQELANKTVEFRQRLTKGEDLKALLPEAFATVREAGKRVMGMRHYDVQLIGAMVLHDGKISEMRTGEGKTLVATLTVYLNALEEKGVHVVTVNDYLAKRDSEWMGKLYNFLGLSAGVVVSEMDSLARKQAYAADITYGTNNEFGFDYLRDNMAFTADERVQRGLNYAIVDEVDSILIDEARTPLIISGPTNDNSELYQVMNKLVQLLEKGEEAKEEGGESTGDFTVDEKSKQIHLTEQGHEKIEQLLIKEKILPADESLYSAANINLVHYINAAVRAHAMYQKNVQYILQNDEVVIVDEFTGRTMPGRRWSEGLHQAVEAKEGVLIQNENQTLASITFQNYFRLYNKLAGMTGTADTEAFEFQSIYNLEVIIVPTNVEVARIDYTDLVYLNHEDKFQAIAEDIKDCVARRQPVLAGTASIEASELLSKLLDQLKIKHEVLNAKQHEREAHIIAQAGQPGVVTIATNMAGRGTDIVLGGNLDFELAELGDKANVEEQTANWQKRHNEVLAAGGLHVIGSERHESRRIDNQLRGRAGRQGDAGSSRFYLSLNDDLMRIFASDRVAGMMQKLGMEKGEAIEHPWVSRAIENAQRKVEGHNFDMRKQLLEYDDVANDQRKVVYEQRNELMDQEDVSDIVTNIRADIVDNVFSAYVAPGSVDELWDIAGLEEALETEFGLKLLLQEWLEQDDELDEAALRRKIYEELTNAYETKEQAVGSEVLRRFEKYIMLQVLDSHWKDHLAAMDYLRQSIGLRGYAQKNPKQEYRRESYEMFSQMLDQIKQEVISVLSKVQIQTESEVTELERSQQHDENMVFAHDQAENAIQAGASAPGDEKSQPFVREKQKLGRNEPCWCGSGKKFKQCHGKLN